MTDQVAEPEGAFGMGKCQARLIEDSGIRYSCVKSRGTHGEEHIWSQDETLSAPSVGLSPEQLALQTWWYEVAGADVAAILPKVGEYTSADLEIMGDVMEQWGLVAKFQYRVDVPYEEQDPFIRGPGMEAACMWYILGKVARAVAAYRESRIPSEDTLKDIVAYAMIARRIREIGRWP